MPVNRGDAALAEADDPDAAPLELDRANAAVVIPPRKVAISIRPDQDVLDHVKRDGAGYRKRINAVLRASMQARARSR